MKVLIIKLSAFGDLIHCLPALDDVLARDEVSEVHWLVDSRFAFVTEVFPEAVTVHTVDLKGEHPVCAAWAMIRQLRREQFDVVIDLQSLIKSSLLAASTGAKVYGYDAREIKEKPATWLQTSTRFHADERHVVQKYRHVAAMPWLDAQAPAAPLPYIAPRIYRDFTTVSLPDLPPEPYVVLSLGGSWQTKELPDATWRQVVEGIQAQGLQAVFCWGSAAEQEKALRIAAQSSALVLPERLAMPVLCALLVSSAALIATDTGMLHLAAALGVPTVSFWGPSASWRSAPLGDSHVHVQSNPPCGPCFKRQCANFVCMDMVRADDITDGLRRILQGESLG